MLCTIALLGSNTLGHDELEAMRARLYEDGIAIVRGFSNITETSAMIKSMELMVSEWWQGEQTADASKAEVFRTDSEQVKAQATSDYFFSSADRVHFFREPPSNSCTEAGNETPPPLNKVGHGLHLDATTPFGRYSQSPKVAAVLTTVLQAPVLPQSMYIFKPAAHGSVVTAHQDATFLYTTPRQTVVGLWLALHDATITNGCLWARKGSHREPVRRKFVRVKRNGTVAMEFEDLPDGKAAPQEAFFNGMGPTPPRAGGLWTMLTRFLRNRLRIGASTRGRQTDLARGQAARVWEGTFPPSNLTAEGFEGDGERSLPDGSPMSATLRQLRARGYEPLPVSAGDLVIFFGTTDHLSLPNFSPHPRHTFQLHAVDGPDAGYEWHTRNWLQYDGSKSFLRIT